MDTRTVDATCIHGFSGGRCTICIDLTTAPHLPAEGWYVSPVRDTDRIHLEATGDAFHGPDTRYRHTPLARTSATVERIHRATAERERDRKRHDLAPPAYFDRRKGAVTVTCGEEVDAPSELDTFLADWAERLGVSLT